MAILISALLVGSKLGNAIKSHGKAAATFAQSQHLYGASALNHLQDFGGVEHLQALYEVTPMNYRPALKAWALEFGRCKFVTKDAKTGATVNKFAYDSKKKGDIEGALKISPAEFAKAPAARVPGAFDYVAKLESEATRLEKMIEDFEANNAPMAIISMLEALHDAAKAATTKAAKFRVDTAKPAVSIVAGTDKAAPAKAKADKSAKSTKAAPVGEAAPVASEAAAA